MSAQEEQALNDFLAYMGGALLALCLVPEIVLMARHHSAADVSLSWSLMHIAGLLFTFAYMFRVQAVAGYLSLLPELVLIVCVLAAKVYWDRQEKGDREGEGESASSSKKERDKVDVSDKENDKEIEGDGEKGKERDGRRVSPEERYAPVHTSEGEGDGDLNLQDSDRARLDGALQQYVDFGHDHQHEHQELHHHHHHEHHHEHDNDHLNPDEVKSKPSSHQHNQQRQHSDLSTFLNPPSQRAFGVGLRHSFSSLEKSFTSKPAHSDRSFEEFAADQMA